MRDEKWLDELGSVLGLLVAVALLLIFVPPAYVIKVLVQTGSLKLLVLVGATTLFAVLAYLAQLGCFVWLAIVAGLVSLVLARLEETRRDPTRGVIERPRLPFEEYRW